jgi:serine/threonine-protein kinase
MNPSPKADPRLARLARLMSDRYEFLSLVGRGGSGAVFEVRNRSLDRREALKVLADSLEDEGASDRFVREARIAASLDHPGIVKIHGFGREEGIHWYSMALVEGPTLADLGDGGQALDASMLAGLLLPVLEALEFSHGRGVIHRDIKPANILFDLQGNPYLTDFGIAKTEESVLTTQTGVLLGTPAYVSPEQALGEKVDARTDQYSLGITIYRVLTGRLPFASDNLVQTLVQRLHEDPEPLEQYRPDLGPELSRIIMRALARDRQDRWPSVAEMKAALTREFGTMDLQPGPFPLLCRQGPAYRRPLPDLPATATVRVPGRGSLEPTADMSRPVPRARSRWYIAAALALAGLAWFFAAGNQRPTPGPPQPSLPQSGAALPAEAPRADATPANPRNRPPVRPGETGIRAVTEAKVDPGRRPVVYPQLIEEAAAPAGIPAPGCSGLRVNVSLVVGADGLVKHCKVLSAIRPECADAARAMALRYRFKPALDAQGRPLETTVAAAVDFPETS